LNPEVKEIEYPSYVFNMVKYKKIEPDDLKIISGKKLVSAHIMEIGQSIAHDSHNVIIVGTNFEVYGIMRKQDQGIAGRNCDSKGYGDRLHASSFCRNSYG